MTGACQMTADPLTVPCAAACDDTVTIGDTRDVTSSRSSPPVTLPVGGTALFLLAFGIAREARARPGDAVAMLALLRECAAEAAEIGDISGFDRVGAAAFLRVRPAVVDAVLAALETRGLLRDGRVTLASPVAAKRPPLSGRERQANYRARLKARRATQVLENGRGDAARYAPSPAATLSPDESLSLFPQNNGEKEREQPRAQDASEGFAQLKALWPVAARMADAEREYRRAVRHAEPATLLALAHGYLELRETKEPWRHCLYLVNWLRTQPWRDPVLPLTAAPRLVETAAGEPTKLPDVAPHALGEPGERLRARIGAAEFRAWFGDVEVEVADAQCAVLSVPTRFVADRLTSHYREAVAACWGTRCARFRVRTYRERGTA